MNEKQFKSKLILNRINTYMIKKTRIAEMKFTGTIPEGS